MKKLLIVLLIFFVICTLKLKEKVATTRLTTSSYTLNLNQFNINLNDPISVSNGLNAALVYVKNNNIDELFLPLNTYIISETIPVIMQSNVTLNLNGGTIKINKNGLQSYVIVKFANGIENAKIINGTIQGDRHEHDYTTIPGTHEWGLGVLFDESKNSSLEKVTIKEMTGYGINTTIGKNYISNLGIPYNNFAKTEDNRIKTIIAINMSKVIYNQFEISYNLGYMGYPYMKAKEFDVEFFDTNMNSIGKKIKQLQYKKVQMPANTKYAHFTFYQSNLPTRGDTDFGGAVVFVNDYHQATNITAKNCIIEKNRTLGIGITGGDGLQFEQNILQDNNGQSPGYDVDLEDGWEYMQNITFKNNIFKSSNNVVSPAGDNITFDQNDFYGWVYMWERTTNYAFTNNIFRSATTYNYSDKATMIGNDYLNGSSAKYIKASSLGKATIQAETFIDASIVSSAPSGSTVDTITNSTISTNQKSDIRINGSFLNCTFTYKGYLVNSSINDSTIQNTAIQLLDGNSKIQSSTITNSTMNTHSYQGSIIFDDNIISNLFVSQPSWSKRYIFTFTNNNIAINQKLLELSVPLTQQLTFTNNKVKNTSTDNTIYLKNDIGYAGLPNMNVEVSLIENCFIQPPNTTVISSAPIPRNMFTITLTDNPVTANVTLNGIKYSN